MLSLLLLLLLLACNAPCDSARSPDVTQRISSSSQDGISPDCKPAEVHLAFTGREGEMLVMWRTEAGDCPDTAVAYQLSTRPHVNSGAGSSGTRQPRQRTAATWPIWPGRHSGSKVGTARSTTRVLRESDMCEGPANGTSFTKVLHTALLQRLLPGQEYEYTIGGGDDSSAEYGTTFRFVAPAAPGPDAFTRFMAFGDMGDRSKDPSAAALQSALAAQAAVGDADFVMHLGDLSYADGKYQLWDSWMQDMQPVASTLPYMVAIGNHEYDYRKGEEKDPSADAPYHPEWGNFGAESGGECGVMATSRFTMPGGGGSESASVGTAGRWLAWLQQRLRRLLPRHGSGGGSAAPPPPPPAQPPFWYAFDHGAAHIAVISTEHDLSPGSVQFRWLRAHLASVDRCVTPWLLLVMHRPMYVVYPHKDNRLVGQHLQGFLEQLLHDAGVDLVLSGHVHSYARSCEVFDNVCVGRQEGGGTVHLTIGTGGHSLSDVEDDQQKWVVTAMQEYGFGRITVDGNTSLVFEFVRSEDGKVLDSTALDGRAAPNQQCGGRPAAAGAAIWHRLQRWADECRQALHQRPLAMGIAAALLSALVLASVVALVARRTARKQERESGKQSEPPVCADRTEAEDDDPELLT